MFLSEMEVENLRCLRRAELEFHPAVNLIHGENGAGKTSVLEAVHLLARGRSFRTRNTDRLVTLGQESLRVLVRLAESPVSTLGFGYSRDAGTEVRIDRRSPQSLAELSVAFPALILDPGIHRLVEEGPSLRRRWLDWGVFHVEPGFVQLWSEFSQALKQRNAALKLHHDPKPWDHELSRLGEALHLARRRTVELLLPHWQRTLPSMLEMDVGLSYFQGWSLERTLAESLEHHLASDLERGTTGQGPHRFDVILTVGRRLARDYLSRGQQKLLGAAMSLSMAKLVATLSGRQPTLLLDDPAAELDAEKTSRLLTEVQGLQGQLIMTSLDARSASAIAPDRVFHVEQGRVVAI
jgi:DNA replication and repair protein RecF